MGGVQRPKPACALQNGKVEQLFLLVKLTFATMVLKAPAALFVIMVLRSGINDSRYLYRPE